MRFGRCRHDCCSSRFHSRSPRSRAKRGAYDTKQEEWPGRFRKVLKHGERACNRTCDRCLKRVAKLNSDNNSHVQLTSMHDIEKSMRCTLLGVNRFLLLLICCPKLPRTPDSASASVVHGVHTSQWPVFPTKPEQGEHHESNDCRGGTGARTGAGRQNL